MTTDMKQRVLALRQQSRANGATPDNTSLKLQGLIEISQTLAQASNTDVLFEQVAQVVCDPIHADQAFLLVQDSASGQLTIRSQFSQGELNQNAVSMSICSQVFDTGEAIFIPEALDNSAYQGQESVVMLNLRSVMAAPIQSQADVVGVLYVCSYTTGELFKEADLDLLKAYASQIGVNWHRTWVLAEKDRLYQKVQTIAATRGRVVEVATHELGSPLHQINIAIELTQKHIAEIQKLDLVPQDYLDQILLALGSAFRGVNHINQHFVLPLRSFYDLELLLDRLNPKILGDESWRSMVREWQVLAAAHEFEITARLPASITVDPDLFKRALSHLIQNAVSYTDAKKRIEVVAEIKGDVLEIRVLDEGLGIPAEDLPQVGTWLYRGANVANIATAPPGLGIGLNSAKRIVEAHRGYLNVESSDFGTMITTGWPL